MNELPIVEGYVRLSLRSILIIAAIIALNIIYFVLVRLEFKDGRKPLKIKLSDLDAPVEILYRNIVERINL